MSGFTKSVVREHKFDGDTVTFELSRLKRKHVLALSKHINSITKGNIGIEEASELLDDAAPVLDECILSINGLKDADGKPISREVMLEESYFLPLLSDVLNDLMEISFVSEEEAGN